MTPIHNRVAVEKVGLQRILQPEVAYANNNSTKQGATPRQSTDGLLQRILSVLKRIRALYTGIQSCSHPAGCLVPLPHDHETPCRRNAKTFTMLSYINKLRMEGVQRLYSINIIKMQWNIPRSFFRSSIEKMLLKHLKITSRLHFACHMHKADAKQQQRH